MLEILLNRGSIRTVPRESCLSGLMKRGQIYPRLPDSLALTCGGVRTAAIQHQSKWHILRYNKATEISFTKRFTQMF